ncbi:MAG: hypothetical protein E7004_05385 [Alphaproteobacteria bacterium]|nr:hypothetical protein [Alphaproteobacteria bacterium]
MRLFLFGLLPVVVGAMISIVAVNYESQFANVEPVGAISGEEPVYVKYLDASDAVRVKDERLLYGYSKYDDNLFIILDDHSRSQVEYDTPCYVKITEETTDHNGEKYAVWRLSSSKEANFLKIWKLCGWVLVCFGAISIALISTSKY